MQWKRLMSNPSSDSRTMSKEWEIIIRMESAKKGKYMEYNKNWKKKKHHKKIRNMRETTCGIVDGGDEFIFS